MPKVATANESDTETDVERTVIPYEIETLDLEKDHVVLILDKTIVSIAAGALQRASISDGHGGWRPHKAMRSLGARLAKIRHIFDRNEPASECLDIANEIYDFDGTCLKHLPLDPEAQVG